MHALLVLRSGERVRLHCLHPAPPSPTENPESSERDAELVVVGRQLFIRYPAGQGTSKLKVPLMNTGTGRNLNTVGRLAAMLAEAQAASERFAADERIEVAWEKIWSIEPILFDDTLLDFCEEAVEEVAGSSHRLPSGPLHDAAEVSRAGVPTVMLFVQSLRGLSHTKLEDTKEPHLELAVAALDRLAAKTVDWVASGGGR